MTPSNTSVFLKDIHVGHKQCFLRDSIITDQGCFLCPSPLVVAVGVRCPPPLLAFLLFLSSPLAFANPTNGLDVSCIVCMFCVNKEGDDVSSNQKRE